MKPSKRVIFLLIAVLAAASFTAIAISNRNNSTHVSESEENLPSSSQSPTPTILPSPTLTPSPTPPPTSSISPSGSEIQVSGTVVLNSSNNIWPEELQFVVASTNTTYTATVHLLGRGIGDAIVQNGTYAILLPNYQNYKVTCLWGGFFSTQPFDLTVTYGKIDLGILFVNAPVGVTSIRQDYIG